MNQPVTNEACENRRCEIRGIVEKEVSRIMGTVNHNHNTVNELWVRMEKKIDDNNDKINYKIDSNNDKINDKMDTLKNMMLYLILAIVLGALGVKIGWI